MIYYLFIFIFTFSLSIILTLAIKKIALNLRIVDNPGFRKIHSKAIPLLGGIAIFLAFFLVLFFSRERLVMGNLNYGHWLGFFLGGVALMVGGFLDDKYSLKPKLQLIFPIVAAICVILGGVGIQKISDQAGGFIYLDNYRFLFFSVSDLIIFLWLMGMMYTTKLLDGLDGLVTGVSGIGASIIFLFTMTTRYFQPDIGLAALVLAAACFGFLVLNFNPAKIFLGEGGSLFLGFALGVLSIISGGKIAIALLIMGIPILDVVWTIVRRLYSGKNPFKFSDRKHLHHRLLDLGWSQRQTVLFFYAFSLIFGLSALFLQSRGKLLFLGFLVFLMVLIVAGFSYLDKKANEYKKNI
jgi:UDP-GlcNAc:undecaprenyl-phosphate/decaprenyl-phosphate GlcNAc-1-phosphate transferase